jgi:predicted nucleotidyltransferase
MLEIINNLVPFFEDCYRRISVREYAKLVNISPPTASKLLAYYHKEGFLKKEEYRNYIFFYANKDNKQFIDFSRIYWKIKLKEIIEFANKKLLNPCMVLFGSLAKAEAKKDSDIDLAIFASKKVDFSIFESKLKRKIQIFWFKSLKDIKSEELANNILNDYILNGRLKL